MPNSLQSSDIASPASRRATNCSLSSITEHSFQGIITPSPEGESVTYVSGTMCYLCLGPLTVDAVGFTGFPPRNRPSERQVLDAVGREARCFHFTWTRCSRRLELQRYVTPGQDP